MSFSLLPGVILESVTQLTPQMLHAWGVELLILDFDNTIVPYTTNTPTEEMTAWLKEMCASDIRVCVVSNSRKGRVKVFCEEHALDCITHANKPFPKGIRQCLAKYATQPGKATLAGDQIYTDILGANCAGVRSVLVRAIHNHNFWLKLRHVAELPFIFIARNRRITK